MCACRTLSSGEVKAAATRLDLILGGLTMPQRRAFMIELNTSDDREVSDVRSAMLNTAFDAVFNFPNVKEPFFRFVSDKMVVHMPLTEVTTEDLYIFHPSGADKLVQMLLRIKRDVVK
jgi:hypothetical protein